MIPLYIYHKRITKLAKDGSRATRKKNNKKTKLTEIWRRNMNDKNMKCIFHMKLCIRK